MIKEIPLQMKIEYVDDRTPELYENVNNYIASFPLWDEDMKVRTDPSLFIILFYGGREQVKIEFDIMKKATMIHNKVERVLYEKGRNKF